MSRPDAVGALAGLVVVTAGMAVRFGVGEAMIVGGVLVLVIAFWPKRRVGP